MGEYKCQTPIAVTSDQPEICGAVKLAMPVNPANAITLSCKSRPPCRPPSGGATAAATNKQGRDRDTAAVPPACSSDPPEGGTDAEPRLDGFCQLVRVVSRRATGRV